MLKLTNTFKKNVGAYKQKKRIIINQGGSSSSKTFSTLQLLTRIAMTKSKQIDVAGLTVPHLKAGVLNDMPHVASGFNVNFHEIFNKSDKKLTFDNAGEMNFIAIDNVGKAHGGRRDILYLNEANHIPYPIAEQLMMRTRETIFIDYNPSAPFWVQNILLKEQPDECILIKSTYKDNQFVEQAIIDTLEARAKWDTNFRRVYVEGEMGIPDGLIFENFEQKEFNKHEFDSYHHGLDWGFSQDPFAYIRMHVDKRNNHLYICDELYQKGLLNKDSAPMVKEIAGNDAVFCDSAEPKSIAEYQSLGLNARSVKKGAGSIEQGIKFLQSFEKIYIHPSCTHVYNEFCNYSWKVDKNGEALPTPVDNFNHAIDAIRYGTEIEQNYMTTKVIGMRPF